MVFRMIFPAIGYRNLGKEIRLYNLKGQGTVKKLRHFLSYLRDFGTKVFLVTDRNEDIRYHLQGFVREGLLQENHWMMWPKDFEDLFESELIVAAMKNISQEKEFVFDVTAPALDEQRQVKGVATILQQYTHSVNQINFVKVDLARELANRIVHEIHSEKNRQETNIEKALRKIMKIVTDDLK